MNVGLSCTGISLGRQFEPRIMRIKEVPFENGGRFSYPFRVKLNHQISTEKSWHIDCDYNLAGN